jgi:hypothetical protein
MSLPHPAGLIQSSKPQFSAAAQPRETNGPVTGAFPVAGQDLNLRPPGYAIWSSIASAKSGFPTSGTRRNQRLVTRMSSRPPASARSWQVTPITSL